jgi:fructan beta-fructosidase
MGSGQGNRRYGIMQRITPWLSGTLAVILLASGAWAAADILIADFEGDDYGDWEVTGEAFGAKPAQGTLPNQMRVTGFRGKGLANSYVNGDGSQGTMTSPEFTIQRPFINFLIGGGMYPGEACINLIVNGEVARTATGPNDRPGGSERLRWATWDVADLHGQTARIRIVDRRTGGWGHINIDHIHQSEKTTVLPDLEKTMRIEKQYLNFPVKNGADMRLMKVMVDGKPVRQFNIELADGDPDFWAFVDATEFKGQDLTFATSQPPDTNPDSLASITRTDAIEGAEDLYREKLRPQFHFTSRRGWNNDPNGMVYYAGEYHLFYQHNPFGIRWGNMTWGHAVSTDMVHWAELPDALHPDELGTIFSGSAVVDVDNTAGFQTGDEKVIVCIYTAAGDTSEWSKDQPFTQCIAYSNDRGRTWTKYAGNPVLGHISGKNRDPKVIWHGPSQQWVMALYLDHNDYVLYGSPNLKEWTELCELEVPNASECPDFFELPVDRDPADTRWLYWAANGTYVLGEFDGKAFVPEGDALKYDWGGNSYAAQTFSDIPASDGRRIQICWGRGDVPGMPFNQMMTFPTELTLRTTDEGVRLFSEPVIEIEALHGEKHAWRDEALKPGENLLAGISGDTFHIRAEFELGKADEFGFMIRGIPVCYDAKKRELRCHDKNAPLEPQDGKVRMEILVDRTSIELFGADGQVYLPVHVIPKDEDMSLELFSKGGKAKVNTLEVYEVRSAWGT